MDELLRVGVSKDNIFWFEPDVAATHRDNTEVDAIYVCGGNTFYLLKKLKECGLYDKMQKWVSDGLLYIGASAGSVIASPDISYILCMDTNDCDLDNTSGLSLISESLIPHYTDEFADAAEKLKKNNAAVVTITDAQALVLQHGKEEKIG